MTKFLELVKGAPNFNAMERDELVVHAYAMFAAGAKADSENAKLRELVQGLWFAAQYLGMNPDGATGSGFARQMRELGIEV